MHDKLLPSEIKTVLQHLDAAEQKPHRFVEQKLLSKGKRRSTIKLTTDAGDYVVYAGSEKFISPQSKFERYLSQKGAPVPKVIGEAGTLASGQQFYIIEFIKGKEAFAAPTQDMEAFGRALAQLHMCSEDYFRAHGIDPNHRGAGWAYAGELLDHARDAENFAVRKWLQDEQPVAEPIMRAASDLRKIAHDLPDKKFTAGLAHRDAHHGNAIIDEHGQATIIDLETCAKGMPLRDIAFAIFCMSTNARKEDDGAMNVTFDMDKTNAFLHGYESAKSLSKEEKRDIFELIKIQAKTTVTLSQLVHHNRDWTSADYEKCGEKVISWADRVLASHYKNGQLQVAADSEVIR